MLLDGSLSMEDKYLYMIRQAQEFMNENHFADERASWFVGEFKKYSGDAVLVIFQSSSEYYRHQGQKKIKITL